TRGRYYRTGDLAQWRTDGVLELFGRDDRQVKVRGHRIELPELEAILREHDQVGDAAVEVVGDPQADAELRAFVLAVPGTDAATLPNRLWPYLRDRLPPYALPPRVLVLDRFPATANGKLDHAALRAWEVTASATGPAETATAPDPDPQLTQQ